MNTVFCFYLAVRESVGWVIISVTYYLVLKGKLFHIEMLSNVFREVLITSWCKMAFDAEQCGVSVYFTSPLSLSGTYL